MFGYVSEHFLLLLINDDKNKFVLNVGKNVDFWFVDNEIVDKLVIMKMIY